MKISRTLAVAAILISLSGVVIHVGALFAGLSWFKFFNAPRSVVESYESGTWLAPVSCLVIACLMAACAYWAASTLAWVRRPPMQRAGLAAMATVCIARALLLPALAIPHPELRNTFEVVAAVIWGLAGIGLAFAFTLAKVKREGSQAPVSRASSNTSA
jgi:hypothetical protein